MVFRERSEEERSKRRASEGFGKLLSNKDNLMLMCLLGEALFLLKVFQKKLRHKNRRYCPRIKEIHPKNRQITATPNTWSMGRQVLTKLR